MDARHEKCDVRRTQCSCEDDHVQQAKDFDAVLRFWNAPNDAHFTQDVIELVLGCSEAKLERDRWAGVGLPYTKHGRRVLYRKGDLIGHLQLNRKEACIEIES